MSEPIPVGVVGVGDFGERHVAAYSRAPGVTVVGVADADAERARAVAERWGVPRSFADGADLIATCRPAGVSVATPGQHHLAAALMALEHGCSVLVEKPVAMSSADASRLLAAEAASAAFVMPAHILRFADPYITLRDRVRRGAVGTVLAVSAVRDRPRSHEDLFPGVHPALMTMVHDIDLALWISGARATRVSAWGMGAERGPPLVVWAHVETDADVLWSIRTSWLIPDGTAAVDRLEVYGSGGMATVAPEPAVRILATPPEAVDHELTPDAVTGAIDAEVRHFCQRIAHGDTDPVVTLGEAAHGIAVAEAVARSAAAGGTPERVAG